MVEIYNETIQDLLTKSVNQVDIRSQGNKIVLPGITEMPVESEDDISNIMDLGQQNRTTAATKMNSTRWADFSSSFLNMSFYRGLF